MSIFDAIWRRRGRPNQHELDEAEEEPTYAITQTDRNYSDLLEYGDVAVKFWLPELMDTILNEVCNLYHTTQSNLIRHTLFTYLYGRYDWLGLYERKSDYYQLNRPPMYSRSPSVQEPGTPDLMQDLGKNVEDLKVWIPAKMKDEIQALADKAGLSLSEMIREILLSILIGHTYLAARKELMQMKIEVEEISPE